MSWILLGMLLAQPHAAKLAMQQGKFDEAARLYSEMAKQYPDEPMLHYNVGLALYSAKKYAPAHKELQIANRERIKERCITEIIFIRLLKKYYSPLSQPLPLLVYLLMKLLDGLLLPYSFYVGWGKDFRLGVNAPMQE